MAAEDELEKSLRGAFERRWRRLVRRTENVGNLELPDKGELWEKVKESWESGFKCEYCGRKMLVKDSEYPHGRSFSLDHRVSLDLGGDNSTDNFAVACHRCNIVKGTLQARTFEKLLKEDDALLDNPEFLNRVFSEMWDGRLANKLERERAES